MNPIQCRDPECLFELECDTCPTGFHMVHVRRQNNLFDFIIDTSEKNPSATIGGETA